MTPYEQGNRQELAEQASKELDSKKLMILELTRTFEAKRTHFVVGLEQGVEVLGL